jgi:hydrogenase maturation protease
MEIVHRLEGRKNGRLKLRRIPSASVELLEMFDEAELILFVDAVSSSAPPGTLHLVPLPWPDLEPRALGALSTHGWGLTETIELARTLGRQIPRLVLLGVEIAQVAQGARRSPEVEAAIEFAVENFSRVRQWLEDTNLAVWRQPIRILPSGCELGWTKGNPSRGGFPCV